MKIKDGFVVQEFENIYIAVTVEEREDNLSPRVKMNGTGVFLWNLMQERDISREELVEEMTRAYDVDPAIALRDITAFEEKLRAAGILE